MGSNNRMFRTAVIMVLFLAYARTFIVKQTPRLCIMCSTDDGNCNATANTCRMCTGALQGQQEDQTVKCVPSLLIIIELVFAMELQLYLSGAVHNSLLENKRNKLGLSCAKLRIVELE